MTKRGRGQRADLDSVHLEWEVKGDGQGCTKGPTEQKWKPWEQGKQQEEGLAGLTQWARETEEEEK